jgi:spore coat protein H
MGVPTPAAWHVSLSMNDRKLGLYTGVESVDQSWLARNGYASGPIFYAVGDQGTLGYLDQETGRRKRYLATGYESADAGEESFDELVQLINNIVLPDEVSFDEGIAQIVDVDRFLRWFIGVEFLAHTDGLVQNYALFRPQGERWLISPWDCDATLGRLPCGRPQQGDEMRLGTGTENYLAVRLLASRLWRPYYERLWEELLADVLSVERIAAELDEIYQEIRPVALQDERRRWSDSTFRREPANIRRFVAERTERIRAMLGATPAVKGR